MSQILAWSIAASALGEAAAVALCRADASPPPFAAALAWIAVMVLIRTGLVAVFVQPAAAALASATHEAALVRAYFRVPRRCLEAGLLGVLVSAAAPLVLRGEGGFRQAACAAAFGLLATLAHSVATPVLVLARQRRKVAEADVVTTERGLSLRLKLALACSAPAAAAACVASAATMDHLGATLFALLALAALTGLTYAALATGMVSTAGSIARTLSRVAQGHTEAEAGRLVSDDELGRAALALRRTLGDFQDRSDTTRASIEGLDRRVSELFGGASGAAAATRAEADNVHQIGRLSEDLDRLARDTEGASERLAAELRRVTEAYGRVGFGTSEAIVDAEGLSRAAENAIEATQQMEQTIARVANRSQGLSQAAADTAASTAAMDDAIARVRLAAEDTASLSARVAQEAERGYRAVHKTLDEIERIRNLVEVAQRTIEDLGSRVAGIGQVVLVIEEIAQKSNLLALNASIIAAQAGEHGRGFAVVASGIKALASRTAASTKEIAAQISGIQVESIRARETMATGVEAVSQGFHVAVGAGDALGEIRQSARAAQKKVHGIARAMEEQAGASRRVADATNQVASMSRELADAVRAHLSGGERIRETAQNMLDIASRVERRLRDQLAGSSYDAALNELQGATQALQRSQKEQQRGVQRVVAASATVREADRLLLQRVEDVAKAALTLREDAARLRRRLEGVEA